MGNCNKGDCLEKKGRKMKEITKLSKIWLNIEKPVKKGLKISNELTLESNIKKLIRKEIDSEIDIVETILDVGCHPSAPRRMIS